MSSGLSARPCTDGDLEVLIEAWPLPGKVHESHFSSQQSGASSYLVAWRSEEPMGSVVIRWPSESVEQAGVPELCHLQVREAFRRQGVGTFLVSSVECWVLEREFASLTLAVSADNAAALRLYAHLGYEPTDLVRVDEYDWVDSQGIMRHEIEHNRIMWKKLA